MFWAMILLCKSTGSDRSLHYCTDIKSNILRDSSINTAEEPEPSENSRCPLPVIDFGIIQIISATHWHTIHFFLKYNKPNDRIDLPGLFVAPRMNTWFLASAPSISVSSWFTTRSLAPPCHTQHRYSTQTSLPIPTNLRSDRNMLVWDHLDLHDTHQIL